MSTRADAGQPVEYSPSKVVEGNRYGWLFVYAVLYIAFLYVPPLFLPLFSFNDSIYVAFPIKGFTFEWYRQMAKSTGLLDALYNSLKVGAVVCLASTLFGMLAAKAMTRYTMPGKGPMASFIMLPLVVPGIILGIALLVLTNQVGLELSLFTIGVSHVLICVPFGMLVLISRLEGFDKSLEEASLDLGVNAWKTFWRVTVPLALPGIIASIMLTFLISFDEFILAFFLAGNEVTLPIYIWSQLRFPAKLPSVLALGTLILTVTMVLVAVAEWIRRRGTATTKPTAG
ncbi:MAG: ABC transporter permease [Alphaproteobacteria bacterium]|nr:ABC transporter permease [Alphaproteobacteria bacterium]